MTITPEMLAAYADGELSGAEEARVAQAVAAQPALAEQVEKHLKLKAMLGEHFAPVLEQEVPARLSSALGPAPQIVDFAAAKAEREVSRKLPRWSWVAGPALAATVALAVFLPSSGTPEGYADAQLASLLENRLVAEQDPNAPTRVLVSFENKDGNYCRAFASPDMDGIACRETSGWAIVEQGKGSVSASGTFRQAGSQRDLLAKVQDMANGPALDAEGEAEAKAAGWR